VLIHQQATGLESSPQAWYFVQQIFKSDQETSDGHEIGGSH